MTYLDYVLYEALGTKRFVSVLRGEGVVSGEEKRSSGTRDPSSMRSAVHVAISETVKF